MAVHGWVGWEGHPGVVQYTASGPALAQSCGRQAPAHFLHWASLGNKNSPRPQHWSSIDPGRERKSPSACRPDPGPQRASFLMCQKLRFQGGFGAGRSPREDAARIQATGVLLLVQPNSLPAGGAFMQHPSGPIRVRDPRSPRPKAQGTLKFCAGREGRGGPGDQRGDNCNHPSQWGQWPGPGGGSGMEKRIGAENKF